MLADINTAAGQAAIAEYLSEQLVDFSGPATFEKFSGGQSNPTYKVTTPTASYVLRSQPSGKLLPSAHAVDREYRVLKALGSTCVPVPRALHLCTHLDITGAQFYLMEFLDGTIHWDAALKDATDNSQRGRIYQQMTDVLVAIHSIDLEAAGLSDYGKPGNYFARQLQRWTQQYSESQTRTIAEMDQLAEWLLANEPEDDGRISLVHGDYRLDNLMLSKDNEKIIAVLDWELSTLGHPFADLAYLCMNRRLPSVAATANSMTGLGGIDPDSLGIPSEAEVIADYCRQMGIAGIDNWAFYLRFSFFRLAAICQGVAKRAIDGNASSKHASSVGDLVQPLATMALTIK
ncbi:MAG: phosphotransferase family protein [Porticoccaceae bacterium]